MRDYFKKKRIVFDKAYCSTQERASDTLKIIAGPEMDYERLKDLKEKNYGPFEAKKNFWWPLMKFRSGSIEDNREVVERMERGINLILRDAKDGENILIVGHGDSMGQYIREKAGNRKFHGFRNAECVQLKSNGHEVEYVKSHWPARKMDETPIFKITKLNIAENDRDEYIRKAEKYMHDSIPAEEGTLVIGSAHDDAKGEDNYKIELFRNKEAEDVYIASMSAVDFEETVDSISTDKKIVNLKPEVITTHAQKALNSYADNFVMRLVTVEVKEKDAEKFSHSVKKKMTTSIASEPGMEIMMSGTNKDDPNEWYFVEVYANDEAYDSHVQIPHYKEYIEETDGMVIIRRDVKTLVRDVLATQGAIVLD